MDRAMDRLRKIVDLMRIFDQQIPAQVLSVFFYVASRNGCPMTDVGRAIGLSESSVSRCTDWLSDYHRLGKPGMGLIVKRKDNIDLRMKRLFLTTKGEKLISSIREILE